MKLAAKTTEELRQLHQEAVEQYEDFKSLHLQLNMARGKPCAEQLDLALGVLEALHAAASLPTPTAMTAGITVYGTVCRRCAPSSAR